MKCSIMVPVFNEKDIIEEIVNQIKAVKLDKEIIIVDDNSQDGSQEVEK